MVNGSVRAALVYSKKEIADVNSGDIATLVKIRYALDILIILWYGDYAINFMHINGLLF